MPSQRINKVNELIKQELARILSREVEFKDTLVTIMRTDTEPDMKKTRVFVSVMPKTHEKGALVTLKKRAPFLQHQLNHTLQMRFVPTLSFAIEKESDLRAGDEVEYILDQIKKEF